MSRTRIVKGKITEIIGKDYNIYSESSIIDNAAEVITDKGVAKGESYGSPKTPPPSPTLAKCLVRFRPNKIWLGEFGFDWERISDSKLEVDYKYSNIIGKYGNKYATEFGAKFTVNNTHYKNILNEYNSFNSYSGIYYIPNMTLKSGETATLDTITHIEEKPDKLHYAYNADIFEITILKKFTVAKGINYDESSIRIKCKKTFSTSETIRVIATKNKYMQKVGEIKILPNKSIKNQKILIIPVEYGKKIGKVKFTKEIDYVNNILKQGYVDAQIIKYKNVFKTGSWWSNWFFTTKNKNGDRVMDLSSFRSLHRYLDDDFMSIKENKQYDSYYRVYCLPDSTNLNGVAENVGQGVKTVIVFQNRDNFTTLVHELLHAMGLYHTFDNNSKFTFELYKTDNVMDYTHHKGKKRFTTNVWQWKIFNGNI